MVKPDRSFVERWREVARVQDMLDREKQNPPERATYEAFDEVFRIAVRSNPAAPTSGFIEFHRILAKKHE